MRSLSLSCDPVHDHLRAETAHGRTRNDVPSARTTLTEIQQEIHKETSKYVRHALRNPGSGAPNPKDAPIPAKVAADHATLATLGQEKLALAARVVRLVQRARARLDHDLARMLVLQGELDPADQAAYAAGELTGRNAAQSLTDSLRLALAPAEPVLALPAAAQTAGAPATKRTWDILRIHFGSLSRLDGLCSAPALRPSMDVGASCFGLVASVLHSAPPSLIPELCFQNAPLADPVAPADQC